MLNVMIVYVLLDVIKLIIILKLTTTHPALREPMISLPYNKQI